LLILLASGCHSRIFPIIIIEKKRKIGNVTKPIDNRLWNSKAATKLPIVVVTTKNSRRRLKGWHDFITAKQLIPISK
jgi:Mlc titration factor MtfA (ptsG expression regulator)